MSTMEGIVEDVIQVGYTFEKEGTEVPFFWFINEAHIDVALLSCLDRCLVWNVGKLAGSDRFMDYLAQQVAGSYELIKLVAQIVKRAMDRNNDECSLDRIYSIKRSQPNGLTCARRKDTDVTEMLAT